MFLHYGDLLVFFREQTKTKIEYKLSLYRVLNCTSQLATRNSLAHTQHLSNKHYLVKVKTEWKIVK